MAKIILWFQIRALEASAQGQVDVLRMPLAEEYRGKVFKSHMNTLAEITRLKAEYRRIKRGNGVRAWA